MTSLAPLWQNDTIGSGTDPGSGQIAQNRVNWIQKCKISIGKGALAPCNSSANYCGVILT